MQSIDHIVQMLELMEHPAFSVRDGLITGTNAAARERMILPGAPVAPMITQGFDAYSGLTSGSMSLTLELFGLFVDATVTCVGEDHIFRLSMPEESEQLKLLARAAQELRSPLNDAMALTRDLQQAADHPELTARLSRELFRILRIVGNMSFHCVPRPEIQDVASVLDELFASAADYCGAAGVTLNYTGVPTAIYSLLDADLLSRAIHNLLTNAIRGAGPGGTIDARLTRRGSTLSLTVVDSGGGEIPAATDIFHTYRQEPGLSISQGLGLGMTIVDAAAKAHGGVVMVEKVPGAGLRLSLTLPIRQHGSGLRSPSLRIDYAGEQSRELIEFAEVLPPEFYK